MEPSTAISTNRLTKEYFDLLPRQQHRTGDIWNHLPCFGLLDGRVQCAGLVITPACDLANHKTDTISYLPIITVVDYLTYLATYACVRPVAIDACEATKRLELRQFLPRERSPSTLDLDLLIQELTALSHLPKVNRALAGLNALRATTLDSDDHKKDDSVSGKLTPEHRINLMRQCLGSDKWATALERIVRNAYADDIHFLPPDGMDPSISAVTSPSVALFRYPLTLNRGSLDQAMDISQYGHGDPIKVTTLRVPFITDLLTRFARLYIRLGSPDLSDDATNTLVSMIDGVSK